MVLRVPLIARSGFPAVAIAQIPPLIHDRALHPIHASAEFRSRGRSSSKAKGVEFLTTILPTRRINSSFKREFKRHFYMGESVPNRILITAEFKSANAVRGLDSELIDNLPDRAHLAPFINGNTHGQFAWGAP